MDRTPFTYYTPSMSPALALVLALAVPRAEAAAAPPAARLAYASGDVTIQSKDGGRLGKTGAAVADGDAVVTGGGAPAIVEPADGSRLKLRESSRFVLTLPTARSPVTDVLLSWGGVFA